MSGTKDPWGKYYSWSVRILLYFLIVFSPLLFSERFGLVRLKLDWGLPYREDMVYFTGLLLLGLAFFRFLASQTCPPSLETLKNSLRIRRNPVLLFLLILIPWLICCCIWSPDPFAGRQSLWYFFACAGIFWTVWQEADSHFARRAAQCLLLPGWLNAVWTFLQQRGLDPIFMTDRWLELAGERIFTVGFCGNPNFLAPFLLICLIASVALLITSRRLIARLIYACSLPVFLLALVFTQTFSVYIGFLFCTLLTVVFLSKQGSLKVGLLIAITGLAICILGVSLYYTDVLNEEYKERIAVLYQAFLDQNWDRLLHGRNFAYAFTWEMILDHPWKGFGLASFSRYSHRYASELPQLDYFQYARNYRFYKEAHNELLQVWVETGLPGLLLSLAALFLWSRFLWKKLRRNCFLGHSDPQGENSLHQKREAIWMAWWGMVAASLVVNSLFSFPLRLPHLAVLAVLGFGISLRIARSGSPDLLRERNGTTFFFTSFKWIAGAAAAFVLCWLASQNIDLIRSRTIRERVAPQVHLLAGELQKTEEPITPRIMDLTNQIAKDVSLAVRLDPYSAQNFIHQGLVDFATFRMPSAMAALEKAERLQPGAELYANMAVFSLRMKSYDKAGEYARKVLQFNPFHETAQNVMKYLGEVRTRSRYPALMKWEYVPLAEPEVVRIP